MPKLNKEQTLLLKSREAGFTLEVAELVKLVGHVEFTEDEMYALSLADVQVPAKDLARLAELWRMTQTNRLAADKEAAKLKAMETNMEQTLVRQMQLQNLGAIGGTTVIVKLKKDMVPQVADWDKFYNYILSEKDFSLLERRPGKAAIKERWEDGVQVPGVQQFPVYKLAREQVKV